MSRLPGAGGQSPKSGPTLETVAYRPTESFLRPRENSRTKKLIKDLSSRSRISSPWFRKLVV